MTISRRQFVATTLTIGASGFIADAKVPSAAAAAPDLLVLENDSLLVAIDRATGCVDRLESKDQAWKLRGAGMRLHVPAPEHRFHFLTERQAGKPHIESDGKQATITWVGFESGRMGKLNIEVRESVRLDGAGAHFGCEIHNNSQAVIESYTYPRLTGLKPPNGDKHMQQAAWSYSGMYSANLWPSFGNEVGYYGYDTPAQLRNLGTDTQFCLILSDSRGVYLGYHDPSQKQVVQVCLFLAPAYVDSFNSVDTDSLGKVGDSTIGVDLNHLCFVQPGASKSFAALVFQPFSGDWHVGADIYKAWRSTWFKAARMPEWVRDVHSWQQIQINSAEDRLEFAYKDLVRYAEACRRWGVKAIQLTGWQIGGQDRDFPLHDIDPRLGTAQEFKDAIAACKKMGVEIILFNKYAWADVTSPHYEEFRKFVIEDPYGNPYTFSGYSYDTPTQIAGINNRRGAGMCMASPAWRKRAIEEFRKSVDLGASGILFDECQWHMNPYCFSKTHAHPAPGAVFSGDVPLIEGFRTIIDSEEFLFAGESPYDIELQAYDLSYFRIQNGFVPFGRYIDPSAPMAVAVTGWDDRQLINACLLYRFSMSYEPRNFHGELDEMPVSLTYGRSVDDLRRKHREWIWDAEFRNTVGARVTVGGKLLTTYTVFRRKDGRRAVVFANMSDTDRIICEVSLNDPRLGALKLISPEQTDPKPWPGILELAPGAAAVVLEG